MYSASDSMASSSNNSLNGQRLTNSLQYLDKVRSLRKSSQNPKNILETYLGGSEITYIDNIKMYGIVKVDSYLQMKSHIGKLQGDKSRLEQENKLIGLNLKQLDFKIQAIQKREREQNKTIEALQERIKELEEVQDKIKQISKQKEQKINLLIGENVKLQAKNIQLQKSQDNRQYCQKQNYSKGYSGRKGQNKDQVIQHMQTQFWTPVLSFPAFQPEMQKILEELHQKNKQQISKPTLKEIIEQSISTFVKELDAQYKLIQEQALDLKETHSQNRHLKEQNEKLQKELTQKQLQEEKLKIFRTSMNRFLENANQEISKSIETQRRNNIEKLALAQIQRTFLENQGGIENNQLQQIKEKKSQVFNHSKQDKAGGNQTVERSIKEQILFLKEENLNLLRSLGQIQYKYKNLQKMLSQKPEEEINDQGTVGQLVKMSRLIKQSIRNLVEEL